VFLLGNLEAPPGF